MLLTKRLMEDNGAGNDVRETVSYRLWKRSFEEFLKELPGVLVVVTKDEMWVEIEWGYNNLRIAEIIFKDRIDEPTARCNHTFKWKNKRGEIVFVNFFESVPKFEISEIYTPKLR